MAQYVEEVGAEPDVGHLGLEKEKKEQGTSKQFPSHEHGFVCRTLPKHDIAFTRWESGRDGGGQRVREGGRTASSTRAARRLIAKSSGWQDRGTCHAIRE